ncbi:MAG: YfhO family protein [Muribaculaceae bacterium]|nr:YfhO family protein [Muribaculaceae bacterium]
MNNKKHWLALLGCVIVIAAISLAFFWPDAIDGNVLHQHDMQQGAANGQELAEYQAKTGEKAWWTNSLFGGMPAFQISPSYASTNLFSWLNSLYGLWLPQPANLLCMMMLGMLILLLTMKCRPSLALIGSVAWGLSSYFVIIIGAGHLWKFITLSYVPPTIAGLVLVYRNKRILGAAVAALFMALQISSNHIQMSYYFAWVMAGLAIAYGVEAYRGKKLKEWGINTAVLAGAMLLAVGANAPNLYHTYEYSKQTMRGRHTELTAQTPGAQQTQGLDRDYITMYSYEKGETFSLLIPNIKGGASAKPYQGGMVPTSLTDTDEGKELMRKSQEMTLLQLFGPYFGGAEGTNGPVYVGAIIMALFLLGCIVVKGPVKWALVVLTVLSIFLAWGRNMMWFTDLFINLMPGYSKFRTVESILVIAEFTIPLLAILGLRELLRAEKPWETMRKPLMISFGVCLFFCLVGLFAPSLFGSAIMGERDQQTIAQYVAYGMLPEGFNMQDYPTVLQAAQKMRLDLVEADSLRSFLFIGIALIALVGFSRGKISRNVTIGIVGVAVLVDLFTADRRYLNHDAFVAPVSAAPFTPSNADRIILTDPDPDYRVLDVNQFASAAPSYFHKSIGGYHAAKLTRYQDLIDRHLNYVARPEITDLLTLRDDSIAALYNPDDVEWLRSHLNVLDMLNTKYIIVDPNSAPILNEGAYGNAWFVDSIDYVNSPDAEMDALETINPRYEAVADEQFRSILGEAEPTAPGDTIRLTSYAPDCLTFDYSVSGPRIAVFSEVYFPWGWNAEADGKPVELARVDYLLRAVRLPVGKGKLVMTFRPVSVKTTNNVAYASIALIYLLLIGGAAIALRRRNE